jgi:transcriptional regulator with XRE-family HTH domain
METKIIRTDGANDLNGNIGSIIKEFREFRGISQYYLGIAIGLSEDTAQQQIYKYEKGLIRMPIDTVFGIAKVLNVDIIINSDNMIFIPR